MVNFCAAMMRAVIQEFLEAEMAAAIGAEKGEQAEGRPSYRSGCYTRSLVTRVGKLDLRVPQGITTGDLPLRFSSSENALVAALTQNAYGVSTRKLKAISEELCGHSFSASAISEINKKLDKELGRFARLELDSEYPYPIIDARYEKLRENGVIRSRAVLVAIGIDWERPSIGRRLCPARTEKNRWPRFSRKSSGVRKPFSRRLFAEATLPDFHSIV